MLRPLAYLWAAPNTLLALLLVSLFAVIGGHVSLVNGVVEVHGRAVASVLRRLPPRPAGVLAITIGHVVLGVDANALHVTRDHERVHVAQYERWGPLFIPAYFLASGWALLRGRDPYRDNRFEREAYGGADGGVLRGPGRD